MISIICPVYNEILHIEDLLKFLINVKPEQNEVLIVDGGSTDGTVDKIKQYAKDHSNLRLLHNPEKYVSYALNCAIAAAQGEVLVRIDGHCDYADDYFISILSVLKESGADIVGGPTRTAFHNAFQQAVGYAISTKFGVGNSKVHEIEFEGESDSVTFGAWKKEIFAKVGQFDPQLKRNQDDEFHYRARSYGLKVYQSPKIRLYYYPRSDLKSLFAQYYEYGLYKPLVLKKVKSEWRLRHIIPTAFALYLLLWPVSMLIQPFLVIPALAYMILLLYFSFANDLPFSSRVYNLAIYPCIHFAYGVGFLMGLNKRTHVKN